jgi:hypothetical protein
MNNKRKKKEILKKKQNKNKKTTCRVTNHRKHQDTHPRVWTRYGVPWGRGVRNQEDWEKIIGESLIGRKRQCHPYGNG